MNNVASHEPKIFKDLKTHASDFECQYADLSL
jgi:hypothetical protein